MLAIIATITTLVTFFGYFLPWIKRFLVFTLTKRKVYIFNEEILIINFTICNFSSEPLKIEKIEFSYNGKLFSVKIPYPNKYFIPLDCGDPNWWENIIIEKNQEKLIRDIKPVKNKIIQPKDSINLKFALDLRKENIILSKIKLNLETNLKNKSFLLRSFHKKHL